MFGKFCAHHWSFLVRMAEFWWLASSAGELVSRTLTFSVTILDSSSCLVDHVFPDVAVSSSVSLTVIVHAGNKEPAPVVISRHLLPASGMDLRLQLSCSLLTASSACAGQVYPNTTNPHVTTGDGIAMAYRAKAVMADMEFIQVRLSSLSRLPVALDSVHDTPVLFKTAAVRAAAVRVTTFNVAVEVLIPYRMPMLSFSTQQVAMGKPVVKSWQHTGPTVAQPLACDLFTSSTCAMVAMTLSLSHECGRSSIQRASFRAHKPEDKRSSFLRLSEERVVFSTTWMARGSCHIMTTAWSWRPVMLLRAASMIRYDSSTHLLHRPLHLLCS